MYEIWLIFTAFFFLYQLKFNYELLKININGEVR